MEHLLIDVQTNQNTWIISKLKADILQAPFCETLYVEGFDLFFSVWCSSRQLLFMTKTRMKMKMSGLILLQSI